MKTGPKILLLDIETAPILGYVWGLWENNLALNQIKSDWHILAWSAKWLDEPASKIMYMDQRNSKNLEDDSKILKEIWNLLDQADIIVTQNGKAFDEKKLNARFILNGFQPPSSYKHIDTKEIASRKFGFTSNKLEYMSHRLCKKYKKLNHRKFSGFELWTECMAGNKAAWAEMEKYNKYDVLALEELYLKLQPWHNKIDFNLYSEDMEYRCSCGSKNFKLNGYCYTSIGKYQRYKCTKCGAESRARKDLLDPTKKKSLRS